MNYSHCQISTIWRRSTVNAWDSPLAPPPRSSSSSWLQHLGCMKQTAEVLLFMWKVRQKDTEMFDTIKHSEVEEKKRRSLLCCSRRSLPPPPPPPGAGRVLIPVIHSKSCTQCTERASRCKDRTPLNHSPEYIRRLRHCDSRLFPNPRLFKQKQISLDYTGFISWCITPPAVAVKSQSE